MSQRVHNRPGHVGMAGCLSPRRAVGNQAAGRGAALDRQERRRDLGPTGIPFDALALDHVLGLEHQGVLRLQAVVNRSSPGEEVFHQVEHPVTDAGNVDADVLDVEALAQLLDLLCLMRERRPPPAVLLQDPELAARLQGRGNDNARRVVAGSTGVIPEPDRAVVERPRAVRVVVGP